MSMFISYCRFANTLTSLLELRESLDNEDLTCSVRSRIKMQIVKLCREIADYYEDEVTA